MKIPPQTIKRILVYRCGTIGDTIVSVPAINLVREHFRDAKLALMTAHQADGKIWADDVLRDFHWFDTFITYRSSDLKRPERLRSILRRIRSFAPDIVLRLSADKNSEVTRFLSFLTEIPGQVVFEGCRGMMGAPSPEARR